MSETIFETMQHSLQWLRTSLYL